MSDDPRDPGTGDPRDPGTTPSEPSGGGTPPPPTATTPPGGEMGFPPVETTVAATPAAKPNIGRYAAIGAVVAAVAIGGIALVASRGGSASLSAGSPTEAVESMVQVLGQGRIIDLVRSEMPWVDELGGIDTSSLAAAGFPGGRIDGITLEARDFTYEVQEVGDSLAVVAITGGSLRAGFDLGKLPDTLKSSIPGPVPDTSFEQSFPVVPIAQAMCTDPVGTNCRPDALQVVTVNDGGGWRVSLFHTAMHLTTDAQLQPRTIGGAESPEAIPGLIEQAAMRHDPNAFFDLLDPREFGWLSDFNIPVDRGDADVTMTLRTTPRDMTASTGSLHVDGFEATSSQPGEQAETGSFDGDCFFEDGTPEFCLSDLPGVDLGLFESFRPVVEQLAADGVNLGVVQRDGRWYLSITQTLAPFGDALATASAEFQRLAETCRSAMSALSGGQFDPEAFANIPEECTALLAPFIGGFGSSSSSELGRMPDDFGYEDFEGFTPEDFENFDPSQFEYES